MLGETTDRTSGSRAQPIGGRELDRVGHGSVLAGRYRLEDRLDAGPEDSLWRAVDETLERQVIVRALRSSHPRAADMVDAARRAALVDDPRLARVLDVGQFEGITYIVTEHVQGRVLTDFLRGGQLPADAIRRIVGEAAQALDRAGSRGLHHLRLSTSSICVVPDGSIKLLGTAIESAAAGVEQDDADDASRIDTVGLVRLLYAGLTGRWPGEANRTSLGQAPRVTGRAVAPAELVAGVPADLDALCTRTLGPGDDGPQTPGELAGQLGPWTKAAPLTDPHGLMALPPDRPVPPPPRRTAVESAGQSGPQRSAGTGAAVGVKDVEPVAAAGPLSPVSPAGVVAPVPDDEVADIEIITTEAESTEAEDSPDEAPSAPIDSPEASPEPEADVDPDLAAAETAAVQIPAARLLENPETAPTDAATLHSAAQSAGVGSGENGVRSQQRITDRQAWPTPAPAPSSSGPMLGAMAPPQVTLPSGPQSTINDPDARGVRRLDPAPPPHLGGGHSGWSGLDRDDERLGPFMPPVPVGRPPREQARLAMAVIAGLVVLGLILSVIALRGVLGFGSSNPVASPLASVEAGAGAASPAPATSASVEPITISSVKTLDPQGDNSENDAAVGRAIDGKTNTAWRSERYDSAQFGGLSKTGVGLILDLGTTSTINEVTVDSIGTGGAVELRTATESSFDGSTTITQTALNDGSLVMKLTKPVTSRYVILWFTKVPKQTSGEFRLLVSEVSLR